MCTKLSTEVGKMSRKISLDETAKILNLINKALEGTGCVAVGYDRTGEYYLDVLIENDGEDQDG